MGSSFSCDLIVAARDHLELLLSLSDTFDLSDSDSIHTAVKKYILFRQGYISHIGKEFAWIEYAHKMHPIAFHRDMESLQRLIAQSNATQWLPSVDLTNSALHCAHFANRIIDQLSSRSRKNIYNRHGQYAKSLFSGHYSDYKKFFKSMRNCNPLYTKNLPQPSIGVEFMWRAHLLDNITYLEDCQRIIGYPLEHNPRFNTIR